MARAYFGKTISYSFSLDPRGETAPFSFVSARLYRGPSAPDSTTVDDEANSLSLAVERVTTDWTAGSNTNEKIVSFSAVSDPDDNDPDIYEVYWVVVNFRLQSGGPIKFTLESLRLYRPRATSGRFDVVAADVYAVESALSDLRGDTWTNTKIALGEKIVLAALEGKGMDPERVELADCEDLVRYKTAEIACKDCSSQAGDRWEQNAKHHAETFKYLFEKARIRYDFDGDGVTDDSERISTQVAYFGR